jgi:hypothetical protein
MSGTSPATQHPTPKFKVKPNIRLNIAYLESSYSSILPPCNAANCFSTVDLLAFSEIPSRFGVT